MKMPTREEQIIKALKDDKLNRVKMWSLIVMAVLVSVFVFLMLIEQSKMTNKMDMFIATVGENVIVAIPEK